MQKYIQLLMLSLLALFAAIYTSCDKEGPSTDNPVAEVPIEGKYKKEILLSDKSGSNKVRLEISTDDKALLDLYNQDGPFAITPVFEEKIENENQPAEPATATPFENGRTPVMVKVLDQTLEKGAIGFRLEVNYSDYSRVYWRGDHWFYDFSSSGNSYVCAANQGSNCNSNECWYNGFRIQISPSSCVSAWFYQRLNGIWYWDCPGSGGYYLCTVSRTSVSWGPVALHALGNGYHVYYYTHVG